jgi:hypothetical protein
MSGPKRYHIRKGDKRTTISVDNILSEVFAIKHGYKPNSQEAHEAIRKFAQGVFDADPDPDMVTVSRHMKEKMLLDVIGKELEEKYWDWRIGEEG